MLEITLAFFTALLITYFLIPPIIRIAISKNLCDEPNERTSHQVKTPSLGGIAIFAGLIFSIVFWTPEAAFGQMQYLLCAFLIIFLIGVKDDIHPLSPSKKLVGQILAAIIVAVKANVLLPSLFGLFGVYELPYAVSVLLTVFTIVVIINSFNLIDGINALSSGVGILIALTFGTFFYLIEDTAMAIMATGLVGTLLAFLRYNASPAHIFMGDTGSLFVGLLCSILAISFLQAHADPVVISTYPNFILQAAPVVTIGILILPLFDSLRVFIIRILKGRSPMTADRNHIHHLLIDYGFSHMQATGILLITNLLFIGFVLLFNGIGMWLLLAAIILAAMLLTMYLSRAVSRKATMNGNQVISVS